MKSSKTTMFFRWIIVAVLMVFAMLPILTVLAVSFERFSQVFPCGLASFAWNHFSVDQYEKVLFHEMEYWGSFWNAVFLTVPSVVLTILSATLAAYGLANMKQEKKRGILLYYIVLSLLPTQVLLVPNFIVLSKLNMIGYRSSIILTACFSPYYTYFLFRFCSQIPKDTFEAARMEGAGELRIYSKIALPQMKPGIWALVLISCADLWNMVEQPLVFLQDETKYPLSLLFRDMGYDLRYAGSIVFSIPLLLLFYASRKDFMKGLQN